MSAGTFNLDRGTLVLQADGNSNCSMPSICPHVTISHTVPPMHQSQSENRSEALRARPRLRDHAALYDVPPNREARAFFHRGSLGWLTALFSFEPPTRYARVRDGQLPN
jgi:hypothetical protein